MADDSAHARDASLRAASRRPESSARVSLTSQRRTALVRFPARGMDGRRAEVAAHVPLLRDEVAVAEAAAREGLTRDRLDPRRFERRRRPSRELEERHEGP